MGKGFFLKIMILAILLGFCHASAIDADETNFLGPITITPVMPRNGESIHFRADLSPDKTPIEDVIIIGGVDSEPLFRKVLSRIPQNGIESVQFVWTSRSGRHRAWFKLYHSNDMGEMSRSIDSVEAVFIVPGGVDSIPWTAIPEPASLSRGNIKDGLLDDVQAELPDLVLPDPPDRYLIAYKAEKISIPIIIKNSSIGSSPASSIAVRCNERGVTSVQELAVPPLVQGEQTILHFEYVPQSEWDILCEVSIDPDQSVHELNENNNSNRFTLQVWTKSLPDLVPSLRYSLISPGKLRWSITVQNIGEKESEPVEYLTTLVCKRDSEVIDLPEIPAHLPKIPALPPGKSCIFNSSNRVNGDICTFTIRVDALDKMPESNEINNSAAISIRLK